MDFDVSGFNVERSAQEAAPQIDVALNGARAWREREAPERLRHGVLDVEGAPATVWEEAGRWDEFELNVDPNSMTTVVRGRGPASKACDTWISLTFSTRPESRRVNQAALRAVMIGTAQPEPPPQEVLYSHRWTAKRASEVLAQRAGLGLEWLVGDDYEFTADRSFDSTVVDAVRAIVAPLSLFTPSMVDVGAEDGRLVVASRSVRRGRTYSFAARDARISNLKLRWRNLDSIGSILLIGARKAAHGSGLTLTFEHDVTTVQESLDPDERVVARTVTTDTIRRPDGAVRRSVQETAKAAVGETGPQLTPVQRSVTVTSWEPLEFGRQGEVLNSPRMLESITETEVFKDGAWVPSTRTKEKNDYDSGGFLRSETSVEQKWDEKKFRWANKSMQEKRYFDQGSLRFQVESTRYTFDKEGNPKQQGTRDRVSAPGRRPGGPGRTLTPNALADAAGGERHSVFVQLLPTGRRVTVSDDHLSEQNLLRIARQAAEANGAPELEVSFQAVAMPFLRVGDRLTIHSLVDDDGEDVDAGELYVHYVKHEAREGPNDGDLVYASEVKAARWVLNAPPPGLPAL